MRLDLAEVKRKNNNQTRFFLLGIICPKRLQTFIFVGNVDFSSSELSFQVFIILSNT